MTYDIRTKLHLLTPSKKSRGKFLCPACQGNNLEIKHSTGAYQCFTNNCDPSVIRKAIDGLEGKPQEIFEKTKPLAAKTHWEYPSRDGKPLIRVTRTDDGNGNKSFSQSHYNTSGIVVTGCPEEIRSDITIYNYGGVQQAILDGHPVFWVEGEKAADALIKIGLVATTTLGGSGGLNRYGDYSKDCEVSEVILCPDKDAAGLKYMAEVAKLLGDKVVGYCLVGDKAAWRNPSGGMDVFDELADHGYGRADILCRVVSVEDFAQLTPKPVEQMSLVVAKCSVDEDDDVPLLNAELVAEYAESQKPFNNPFDPTVYFPLSIATMMISDAREQCHDPASFACYLLPVVSSLIGQTHLHHGDEYRTPNIIWAVLVQGSGLGKSRAEQVISRQLDKWDREAHVMHNHAFEIYNIQKTRAAKDGEVAGQEPYRRRYLIEDATIPKVQKICSEAGSTGAVWIRDELKGLLGSLNRYTNGEGNDKETLLELWGGRGFRVDRIDEKRTTTTPASRISLCGGIQPGIFHESFDVNDSQGFFARFLPFCPATVQQRYIPNPVCHLSKELPNIYWFLKASLNHSGGSWPTIFLSNEAKAKYKVYYDHLADLAEESTRRGEPMAIQHWLRKSMDHVGRVAIAIHALDCYTDQDNRALGEMQSDSLDKAYLLVLWCMDNVYHLFGKEEAECEPFAEVLSSKILLVLKDHPSGADVRLLMRKCKGIYRAAKQENLRPSDYTRKLLKEMTANHLVALEGKIFKLK